MVQQAETLQKIYCGDNNLAWKHKEVPCNEGGEWMIYLKRVLWISDMIHLISGW